MKAEPITPKVGDCIIITKANGMCDICKITSASGERECRRNVARLGVAVDVADGWCAKGGHIWEQPDEAKPDVIKPFIRGYAWGPTKPASSLP